MRARLAALAVLALALVGSRCGGGDGTGGGPLRVETRSPDPRCTPLVDDFPGLFVWFYTQLVSTGYTGECIMNIMLSN